MGIEIERKFLVTTTTWKNNVTGSQSYRQGYLNRDPNRTVRIRLAEPKAWITVKSSTDGLRRHEYEYEIPFADGEEMLAICEIPIIEKVRHLSEVGGLVWEIDEFLGDNVGLIVAEVELESEEQAFEKPPWAGEEVTHDVRYYNSHLSQNPFSAW